MLKKLRFMLFAILLWTIGAGTLLANETYEIAIPITEDSYVQEFYPTASPMLRRELSVGYDLFSGNMRTRTYLKYDLTALVEALNQNQQLESVQLHMMHYMPMTAFDYEVRLFQPVEGWEQRDLEWINQPESIDSGIRSLIVSHNIEWSRIDITALIQKQIAEQNWEFGIALFATNEQQPGGLFWSTDCPRFTSIPICLPSDIPYLSAKLAQLSPPDTTQPPLPTESPAEPSLTLSENNISPESSPGVKDHSVISIKISQPSFRFWELQIKDQSNETVLYRSAASREYTLLWPTDGDSIISDGEYTVYLSQLNDDGSVTTAPSQSVIVDNTPPVLPHFISPTAQLLTNATAVSINVDVEAGTASHLFLNDIEVADFNGYPKISYTLFFNKEGENTLRLESTDLAGNSSSAQVAVFTDWTAPSAPPPILVPDHSSKNLYFRADHTDYAQVLLYNLAGLDQLFTLGQSERLLVQDWVPDTQYSFYAVYIDSAGNMSGRSEISTFHTPTEVGSVLGANSVIPATTNSEVDHQKNRCRYSFNQTTAELKELYCDLEAATLDDLNNIQVDYDLFWLNLYGRENKRISVEIEKYICMSRKFIDPRTWNGCVPKLVGTEKFESEPYRRRHPIIGKNLYHEYMYTRNAPNSYQLLTSSGEELAGKQIRLFAEIYFSYKLKNNQWVDFKKRTPDSNSQTVPKSINAILSGNKKYFRFPFNKAVGVTQWHGKTAFNPEHTGIDFGASKEALFAPANGYIRSVGWDNYYGQCKSGGNYIKIEHDNLMYTVYFHLDNYNKQSGKPWKVGERVKKGDLIGLTGNSGSYNCKPLAYHLHFELRQEGSQSTHINPVDWIDVDWNLILTLGADRYPGRLTGENPHPGK